MRLLLDEQVPRVFADNLEGHEVRSTQAMGWSALENGELLRVAAEAGFEVLVTLDRGIEFQQNLSALPMAVLVVKATGNRIEDLERLPALSSRLSKQSSANTRAARRITRWTGHLR